MSEISRAALVREAKAGDTSAIASIAYYFNPLSKKEVQAICKKHYEDCELRIAVNNKGQEYWTISFE